MAGWRIVKAQHSILGLAAHDYLLVERPDGRLACEINGIARRRDGRHPVVAGLSPFERLVGLRTPHAVFHREGNRRVVLWEGEEAELQAKLVAADAVQAHLDANHRRYPWLAVTGLNSNAYVSTVLRAMGVADRPAPGRRWSPSAGRLLLPPAELDAIRVRCLSAPPTEPTTPAR